MNKPNQVSNNSNGVKKNSKTNNAEDKALLISELRQEFSGPLPHPVIFEQYERILPGAAERILTSMETQSKHRQQLELIAVKSGARDSLIGLIFAFLLGMGTITAGTIIVLNGYIYSGSFFGLLGMGSLFTAFIYGTRSNRKERQEKFKNS